MAAWLLACAGFALALRWRERGALALLAGAAGGGAAYAIAAMELEVARELVVLEGSGDSPLWLRVRAGDSRLALPAGSEAGWVETRPPRAPLRLVARESAQGFLQTLESQRTAIYQLEVAELGSAAPTRESPNRLAPFSHTWVRDPDGTWTQRGAWPLEANLPPSEPGQGEPPSWIQPALPLGVGILIGQQATETAGSGVETWVRLVGF